MALLFCPFCVQEFETDRHNPIPAPHHIQMSAIVDDWVDFSHGSEFEHPTQKTFHFSVCGSIHSLLFFPYWFFFIVFMASTLSYSSLDDIQDAVSCLRVNFDTGKTSNNKLDALTSNEQSLTLFRFFMDRQIKRPCLPQVPNPTAVWSRQKQRRTSIRSLS